MATHKRWDGSAWQDITTFKRWDGSAWQDVTDVKRWDGSAWQDTGWGGGGGGGGVVASVSPGVALGESLVGTKPAKTVTSNSVTVSASGGTGPYTYAWARLSGDSAVLCNSPTAASTTFKGVIPLYQTKSATYRCTVTDSLSATTTVDVFVELTYDPTGV